MSSSNNKMNGVLESKLGNGTSKIEKFTKERNGLTLDEVFHKLGTFGRFQRKQFLLLINGGWICTLIIVNMVYIGYIPEHRCFINGIDDTNRTSKDAVNFAIPTLEKNKGWRANNVTYDQCKMFRKACVDGDVKNCTSVFQGSDWTNFTNNDTETFDCDKWVYSYAIFNSTAVTKWDTVCQYKSYRATADASLMAGLLVGSLVFGMLTDKFGRKWPLVAAYIVQLLAAITLPFVDDIIMFFALRFLGGFGNIGIYISTFVMILENVPTSKRIVFSLGLHVAFSFGYWVLTLMAYLIRDYFWLCIIISLPSSLGFLFIKFVEESPRWLLSQHRNEEAEKLVKKAAKMNGVRLPDGFHLMHESKSEIMEKSRSNALDLVRTPNMRKKSCVLFFCWLVVSLTYYGLTLNTGKLEGSIFFNFFLSGLVELPAKFSQLYFLEKFGRKISNVLYMVVAGICCMGTSFIPADKTSIIVALALTGKASISGSFSMLYTYSGELFPTVIRSNGIGICSIFARIGSMSAPYVILLDELVQEGATNILLGAAGVAAGFMTLLLPETRQRPLPETIADGENFGNGQSLLCGAAGEGKNKEPETFTNAALELNEKEEYITKL